MGSLDRRERTHHNYQGGDEGPDPETTILAYHPDSPECNISVSYQSGIVEGSEAVLTMRSTPAPVTPL